MRRNRDLVVKARRLNLMTPLLEERLVAPSPAARRRSRSCACRRRAARLSKVMPSFDDIVADFAFLDDWDDRYKYLIDLGRALPPFPADKRDDAHKVRGCASQVWLDASSNDGRIMLRGDSDAHIVKGLVAVLLSLYSGKTPEEILKTDAGWALAPLDLAAHLTPQRSNGLASMAARIRAFATEAAC